MTGKVVAVDPNGFLARGKARYPIFESGLDNVVAKFDRVTRQFEKGNAALGVVAVRGLVKHADLPDPALEIHLKIPPGGDPALPKGADRRGYFDPATGEIRLVVTTSFAGELLEYYRFDRFIANPGLTDADFDPSRLWPTGSKATSVGRTTASDAATPAAKLTPADGSTEF